MRGKLVAWGYLLVLSFATILNLYMPKTEAAEKEAIVIPGEAIRLRILANSDLEKDQAIKRQVRDAVNARITEWVQDLTSMERAREVLNAKLPEIQDIAENVVREQGSNQSVKVEFGEVQFPTKLYGQFLYPAGKYQAILITLGNGEGANWWCVLYPPLCFLDFSNGVAVSQGFDDGETATDGLASEGAAVGKGDQSVGEQPQTKETLLKSETKDTRLKPQTKDMPRKPQTKDAQLLELEVDGDSESPEKRQEREPSKKQLEAMEKDHKATSVEKSTKQKEVPASVATEKPDVPVYVAEDEKPVKVKFFVVEMWEKIF